MPRKNPFKLDVVSVRLVKDAPLLSDHTITSPEDAVDVAGELMCGLDREVACIINLKTDGTPINCHFASIGALDRAIVQPKKMFKASILSNAAKIFVSMSSTGQGIRIKMEKRFIPISATW
ncbi:MAG: JAB domain-containing protein [Lachnospiraceae bacterium]|nr:JAB domain-containing protein [Lachnospiraceae bacterium]